MNRLPATALLRRGAHCARLCAPALPPLLWGTGHRRVSSSSSAPGYKDSHRVQRIVDSIRPEWNEEDCTRAVTELLAMARHTGNGDNPPLARALQQGFHRLLDGFTSAGCDLQSGTLRQALRLSISLRSRPIGERIYRELLDKGLAAPAVVVMRIRLLSETLPIGRLGGDTKEWDDAVSEEMQRLPRGEVPLALINALLGYHRQKGDVQSMRKVAGILRPGHIHPDATTLVLMARVAPSLQRLRQYIDQGLAQIRRDIKKEHRYAADRLLHEAMRQARRIAKEDRCGGGYREALGYFKRIQRQSIVASNELLLAADTAAQLQDAQSQAMRPPRGQRGSNPSAAEGGRGRGNGDNRILPNYVTYTLLISRTSQLGMGLDVAEAAYYQARAAGMGSSHRINLAMCTAYLRERLRLWQQPGAAEGCEAVASVVHKADGVLRQALEMKSSGSHGQLRAVCDACVASPFDPAAARALLNPEEEEEEEGWSGAPS